MQFLIRFIDRPLGLAIRSAMWLSGFSVVLIIAINSIDTVGRAFFSAPLVGAVEMTELFLAICIILAIPFAQRSCAHIRVDLFDRFYGELQRKVVSTFSLLVCLTMFAILTVMAFESAKTSLATFESSAGFLRVPIWIGKALAFLGFSLATAQAGFELLSFVGSKGRSAKQDGTHAVTH